MKEKFNEIKEVWKKLEGTTGKYGWFAVNYIPILFEMIEKGVMMVNITDHEGNIVGVRDGDTRRFRLINSEGTLRISIHQAESNSNMWFIYKKDGVEKFLPIKDIVNYGKKKGKNYVYKIT